MKNMARLLLAITFLLFVAACAAPATSQTSSIATQALTIENAWARAVPMAMGSSETMTGTHMAGGMGMGAAYLTIHNGGSEDDQLIKASSDAAHAVELHTVEEKDGMMSMHPVEAIDVPAGGEAVLEPGGFHIMMVGLTREIKPGEMIVLKLTFAKAGEVDVEAEVREQ